MNNNGSTTNVRIKEDKEDKEEFLFSGAVVSNIRNMKVVDDIIKKGTSTSSILSSSSHGLVRSH